MKKREGPKLKMEKLKSSFAENKMMQKLKNHKKILSVLICVALLAGILAYFVMPKEKVVSSVQFNQELMRAIQYEQFEEGDDSVDGSDNVKFSAFFLRDLDGDGYAEKIKGTCKQIGDDDNLYMEIKVQTSGILKDAKIEIDGKNFYLQTSLPKDEQLVTNYIGNNVKEISFNELPAGSQKLLSGAVRSGNYSSSSGKTNALENNINNYTRNDNKVILTGILVEEDGTEVEIRKEISLTVDWYGEATARISSTSQTKTDIENRVDEENGIVTLDFMVYTQEIQRQLLLSKNSVSGTIPELNGYAPIEVTLENAENVEFVYDEETRNFTITRNASTDENGNITSSVSNSNNYSLQVKYPIEAYWSLGISNIILEIPVETYYEGYNNKNTEFTTPYKSNVVQTTITAEFRGKSTGGTSVTVTSFNVNIGEYITTPSSRYVISKNKPLRIYNGLSQVEFNDRYTVTWNAFIGTDVEESVDGGIKLSEGTIESLATDEFVKSDSSRESMSNLVSNVGIYFKNIQNLVGEDGWVKVYNAETDELIETFDKTKYNMYSNGNVYYYEQPVKYIRIETSAVSTNASGYFYHVKELDDEYIVNNYTKAEFDELQYIRTTLNAYINNTKHSTRSGQAKYEAPISIATLNMGVNTLSTQETEENVNIVIKTVADLNYNQIKWKNGTFLIKFPVEILDVELNSVEVDNENVSIDSYELIKQDGLKFIKIVTSNEIEGTYTITINVNISPDPRIGSCSRQVELYADNENITDYYYRGADTYDVNNNLNTTEIVNKVSSSINLVAPNLLLTNQIATEFDDFGSIVVSPEIADIEPIVGVIDQIDDEKTAKIGIQLKNNYSRTVSDIAILGKIPFEGNRYVISNKDLNSTFTTNMTETGVTLPETIQGIATVYYSENEAPTKELDDLTNGWTTSENVTDWNKIKTFLIVLNEYALGAGKELLFEYTIRFPDGLEYNQVAFSHHGVYFSLDTDEGKYRTQVEPNRIGFRIAYKYNLEINKYQKGKEKLVPGATYKIIADGEERGETAVTGNDGKLTFKGLYVGKTYNVEEIKSPKDYVLNTDIVKFTGSAEEENLIIDLLEGNPKEDIQVVKSDGETYKAILKVQDEVKGRVKIIKTALGTDTRLKNSRFKITGVGFEEGKILTTDINGEAILSGLLLDTEYILEEVIATEGYYLNPEKIKFVINSNDSNYTMTVVEGNCKASNLTLDDEIPVINFEIENEKIPEYNLVINKVVKGETTPLPGAKFKLLYGKKIIGTYEADENGQMFIQGLYEYVAEKQVEQSYTLKEIYAPEGFAKVKDVTLSVERIDGVLTLTTESTAISAQSAEVDGDTITITLDDPKSFKLTKIDGETAEVLPGTKFAIYNIDNGNAKAEPARDVKGNIIGTLTKIDGEEYYIVETDETGEISANLTAGLYKAVEIEASDVKYDMGSIADRTYYFGIGESNKGVDIEDEGLVEYVKQSKYETSGNLGTNDDAICLDDNSFVFVDYTNAKLIKHDSNGEYQWDKATNGTPNGIAKTTDGAILVGTNTGYVCKYDVDGNVIFSKQGFGNINTIVTTEDEGYLIGTTNNLTKYNSNFEKIWQISGNFTKAIELEDMDYLVINNKYLEKYTKNGNKLFSISINLDHINDIEESFNGNLAVVGCSSKSGAKIYVFDDIGNLINLIESGGSSDIGSENEGLRSVTRLTSGGFLCVGWVRGATIKAEDSVTGEKIQNEETEHGSIWQIKVNEDGLVEYMRSIGDQAFLSGHCINIDNYGNLYVLAVAYDGILRIQAENTISNEEIVQELDEHRNIVLKLAGSFEVLEQSEIIATNNRKEFNITTLVEPIDGIYGGTISGEGLSPYEVVKYGDSSVNEIKMTPNENYEIISITVNGEDYSFTKADDGTYTMPLFDNVTENKRVVVKYALGTNKLIVNKVDSESREKLSGAKFKLDQIEERTEPESVIGILTDNSQEYIEVNLDNEITDVIGTLTDNSQENFEIDYENEIADASGELTDNGYAQATTDKSVELTDVIGEITNNGTYYFVEQDGTYVPTNSKTYQVANGGTNGIQNSTAYSYIPIDLTSYEENCVVIINATMSSETNYDFGYAAISKSTDLVEYNTGATKFMYISGTVSNSEYISEGLLGGNIYYLHLGYRKDGSQDTGTDQVIINSINVYTAEIQKYDFVENDGKYESTNQGVASTTSNSYIPIDLTNYEGKYRLIVNAQISSESGNDIGYATVTQTTDRPAYNNSTGRYIYISGTTSAQNYQSMVLEGGNIYYLHLGYYKNSSTDTGDDKFTVNSVKLYATNSVYYNFVENEGKYESTNQGVANTTSNSYIPIDLTNYEGNYRLFVNATVSSESSGDYGYINVTETTDRIAYSNSNNGTRILRLSGTNTSEVSKVLTGGKVYYLHFGYYKNGSTDTGDDKFIINSVKLYGTNSVYYNFIEDEGKYESTNQGKANTVSNSYIPIDLTGYTGKYNITVNANVSSDSSDYGYATVRTTTTRPSYSDNTGRFIYISGIDSSVTTPKDYNVIVEGGKIHYLHFGYYKNSSTDTGDDKFTINSVEVSLSDVDLYHVEVESNNEGQAITQVPFGKYSVQEIVAPEGYELLEEPTIIEFRDGGINEFTIENQKLSKITVHHYIKDTTTSLAEDQVIEGKNGTQYTTSPNLDFEKYELEKDLNGEYILPANATGIHEPGEHEVIYYYVEKQIPLTVKHYIAGTNNKVPLLDGSAAEDVVLNGYEGETYTTSAISNDVLSDRYELVEIPSDATGVYEFPEMEVIYYYKLIERDLIINKYKEDGTTPLPGVKFKVDGNEYTTNENGRIRVSLEAGEHEVVESETVDGYKLIETPTTITIIRDTTTAELSFTNERSTGNIIVHHYIAIDNGDGTYTYTENKLVEDEFKTGIIGEIYATQASTQIPECYEIFTSSGNTSGTYAENEQEIIYYYKYKQYDYTVEYYYDGVIDDSKTEVNKEIYLNVVDNYIDKNITGYIFDRTENLPLTIGIDTATNVIKVYYVKDNFDYTVEYYYDETIDSSKTETINATYQDVITTYTDKNITGYRLDRTENVPLTITENENTNVIKVYYVKDNFDYTVEYYYDETIDNSKTEIITATFADVINSYTDKNITGYRLDRTENLPLTITSNPANNVIKVYYVKDNFDYTVEYYYDETIDNTKTDTITATYMDEITTYTDKNITGYKLDRTENLPLTITEVESNNVIKVYYVKDNFNYTVEYYYDETIDNTKTDVITATYMDVIENYTDKNIDGYKLDRTENLPLTITENETTNVIKVYYEKDNFNYTVEYYYDGNIDSSKTDTIEATFADNITNYQDKVIDGYKLERVENNPLTITSNPDNNVMKIYYIKDNFDYTVEYYYDETIDSSKTETLNATFADIIDSYTDKNITGYRLDRTENLPLTITSNPASNVIKVYYVKDNFDYTVEYYYDETIDNSKTETIEATYQDQITTYTDKNITGYRLDRTENLPLTITEVEEANVIKVYYVKDNFDYTVEYYYDETIDNSKTEVITATYMDEITTYVDKNINGYRLDRTENLPLIITEVESTNVIKVYYVKDNFNYTVEYYYDETIDSSKTETITATYMDVIANYTDKNINGYRLDRTENLPLTVDYIESNNVIKVYYVKDNFDYTVEYYYDGIINDSNTEVINATYKDVISTYTDKVIDGYKLSSEENLPLTVDYIEENNIIKIYYVKDIFGYTVEYYYDGNIDNSKTDTIEATFADIITTYEDKVIDGYKLERVENNPLTITSNSSNNVMKIYYIKDNFDYTVEYYYDGNIDDSKTETITATFADIIDSYTDKNITGYRLDRTENLPLTITSNPTNNVIKVYYVKDNFNYTVEYYYDGVIDSTNTETITATYMDEITTYTDKNITGYRLDRTENVPLTITENESTNVIKVYYVKDNFDYTVEYYYDEIIDDSKTEVITATYLDIISTYTDKNIDGYKLDRTEYVPLTVIEIEEANVMRIFYTKDNFDYTVEYYYDETIDDTKTEIINATFADIIDTYTDKNINGYRLDRTENLPLTITSNPANNVIKVYYVKDNFNYTVEYYYDETIDSSKTDIITATYLDEITTYTDKNITGYRLDRTDNLPLIVDYIEANNTIKVYYVKDNFNYTVEYYYDEIIDNTKTDVINSTYMDEITTYVDKNIDGYRLDRTENLPLTITEVEESNVIKVYYVKDNFNYTVEYYYDGIIDDSKTDVINATYKDVISTYTDKVIDGYKLSNEENLPLTVDFVEENNTIKVYYVKDIFGYTVEYYYNGNIDSSKTDTIAATFADVITNYEDKVIDGYKLERVENNPLTVTSNLDNNVMKIYYIKDNFDYTVEYYYDEEIDISKTEVLNATFADIIDSYTDKNITGYKLDRTESLPLTITSNPANNVIKVFYVKDNFNYTVEYYYDETIDDSKTDTITATYMDVIENYQDKNINGYRLDKTENVPLTITENESTNVIKVYYVKDNFNYTVEYYYDGIIDDTKTDAITATYMDVIENYTDKNIDGYRLDRTESLPLTVDYIEVNNVIRIYYVKNTFNYTVEYYYDGNIDNSKTDTIEATFADVITTYEDKVIDGYKLEKVENNPLTITSNPTNNVMKIYYIKDNFDYTVEYYYDEAIDSSKTEIITATFADIIDSYTDKNITGYRLDRTENLPLTITSNEANNVIKVYYVKDNFDYTVEYYYDETIDDSKTEVITATFADIIDGYTDKNITGYRLNRTENVPLTITENENTNVIKIFYEKDNFNYTVEYYYDENIDDTKTDTITATYMDVIENYADKNITGYRLDRTENVPLTITEVESNNVIKVFYVKDNFDYTVEYYYDETIDDSKTDTITATYQDVIETYEDKNITGYRLDRTESLPLTITENETTNVIRVYYVKDNFDYTVEYYYDETIDSAKTDVITATYMDEITTYVDKNINGYRLDRTESLPLTITENEATNVIKVFYVKDNFDYTVEYYYDGIIDDSKTEVISATYQDVISTYTDKVIDGYKLSNEENLPLIVDFIEENNVIKIYYVKDIFGYTVEYYYDGNIDNSKTDTIEATFADIITTYEDKVIDGYKLEKVENNPLTITSNATNNVMKIYYIKDNFDYTVEYYYDELIDSSKTEVINATFADIIDSYTDKNITGYRLDRTENVPLTITSNPVNNVIKVFYVKDNFDYTVEYYYDETIDNSKTETINATYQDIISTYTDKNIIGYRFDKTENLPLTVTEIESNNVIKVYYVKDNFNYTVEYYYDETIDNTKTDVINSTYMNVIDTYTDKNIDGYRLDRTENMPLTITEVEANNVIKVFYVKDNFNYTVEYYYDEIIDSTKTDTITATYMDVIENYQDKNIDGYRLDRTENIPLTVDFVESNNTIKIYYVKDNFNYSVEYYYDGIIDDSKTDVIEATFADIITTYEDKVIDGHKLEKVENNPLTVTSDSNNNVMKIYYIKDNFDYTVEYYYDEILDDSKTDVITATFADIIDTYEDKNITGYRLDRTENVPLTITSNPVNNVIKVFYVKDNFDYTVEYYYDETIDNSKTDVITATYMDSITDYTDKNITGYRFDRTENLPLTVTEVEANNVIKVYYVKDNFDYTVEYYYDETIDSSKTETITATYMDEITTYTDKNITGYRLDRTENLPLTITEIEANNVIKVYYIKDNFDYTVEYYYEGIIDDTKTDVIAATYMDVIENYTDKNIFGYRYDNVENLPLTITENENSNIIKVYYVIDEGNTKELSYTVEYYKDGELQPENTQIVREVVQVLQPDTLAVDQTQINTEDKYVGYRLEITNPEPIPDIIDTGSTIKVYYVKDNFDYTVEYYYDGIIDDTKTDVITATYLDEITTYTDKNITGYRFDKVEGTPLTITENEETNVIKVYYVKDNFNYTVEYYYEGVIDDTKTDVITATYMDVIDSCEDKPVIGYKFEKYENLPLTITENESNNIIKVYYIIDENQTKDISYTVEYYKDSVKVEEDTQVITETVQVLAPEVLTVNKDAINVTDKYEGYRFGETEPETIPDTVNNGDIIKVYYERDLIPYTIEYYYNGVIDEDKTDRGMALYKDLVVDYEDKEEDGYKLDWREHYPLRIERDPENNVIKIYYITDETDTKELLYVVDYYKDGVKSEEDRDIITTDVHIFEPNTITVNKDDINTTDKFAGYKFEKTEPDPIPDIVIDGDLINVYYVRDLVPYTIEYYYDGILDEEKTKQLEGGYGETIEEYPAEEREGYIVERTENLPLTLERDPENNIIKVYYVPDPNITKELSYTIEYYKDGEIVEEDTQVVTETVQILAPDTLIVNKEEINIVDKYVGYKFENTDPEVIPDEVTNGDVIKVYYVKDEFEYTVEYYYDGVQDESKTETFTAMYGDKITEYPEKPEPGYNLGNVENLPLIVTENPEENVIRVYYVQQEYSYTINYYYDGEQDESKTEIFYTFLGDEITTYPEKLEENYELEKVETLPLVITENLEENVINVYYIRKDAQIIIEYRDKNTDEEILEKVILDGKVGDEYDITEYQKEIENYTLVEVPESMTGEFTEETQTKVFYYAKNAKVIVNHIDKNTDEILETEEKTGYVGQEYTASSKEFERYKLVQKPEQETVIMTEETIILNYYYVKESVGVLEKHIDIKTKEVLYEKRYTGYEGDSYTTEKQEFTGYAHVTNKEYYEEYIKVHPEILEENEVTILEELLLKLELEPDAEYVPENKEGTMTREEIIVEYYYIREIKVVVKYLDKETKEEIAEEVIIEGHEGDSYTTDSKEVENYELVEEPENKEGTMQTIKAEDGSVVTVVEVVYYYEKEKAPEPPVDEPDEPEKLNEPKPEDPEEPKDEPTKEPEQPENKPQNPVITIKPNKPSKEDTADKVFPNAGNILAVIILDTTILITIITLLRLTLLKTAIKNMEEDAKKKNMVVKPNGEILYKNPNSDKMKTSKNTAWKENKSKK